MSANPQAVPDTVLHPALREGMGPVRQPASPLGALGYWCFETMTPIVPGTYEAARAAVDVALTTSDVVLAGESAAYGLCRPPGHHSPRAAFGGYCFFNHAAIVAEDLVRRTGGPVAILDVDYHPWAMGPSRSSTDAPMCCTYHSTATRTARIPTSPATPMRKAPGPAQGRT